MFDLGKQKSYSELFEATSFPPCMHPDAQEIFRNRFLMENLRNALGQDKMKSIWKQNIDGGRKVSLGLHADHLCG